MIDAKKDLTPRDLRIMKLSPGTHIYVSNSLIKPEIFRFSTKVSDVMVDVFAEMQDENYGKKLQPILSADDFESLTYAEQVELETQMADKYYNKEDLEQLKQKIQVIESPKKTDTADHASLGISAQQSMMTETQRNSMTAHLKSRVPEDIAATNVVRIGETSHGAREEPQVYDILSA